jgi:hypothetical protein
MADPFFDAVWEALATVIAMGCLLVLIAWWRR